MNKRLSSYLWALSGKEPSYPLRVFHYGCFSFYLPHEEMLCKCRDLKDYFLFLDGNIYLKGFSELSWKKNLSEFSTFLERGMSLPDSLSRIGGGLYNLHIFDKRTEQLHIVSDALGSLPTFYKAQEKGFLIAGNQFDLTDNVEINRFSLIEFLKYGYLPFSPSFFSQILRIQPNGITCFRSNSQRVEFICDDSIRYQNQTDSHGKELLEEAVKRFDEIFSFSDSERIIAGLSGGYDSRFIAAYLTGRNGCLINYGTKGSSESKIAQKVAEHVGLNCTTEAFPLNNPSLMLDSIPHLIRSPISLELSHISYLQKRSYELGSIYIDGFLGDAVLGSSYFFGVIKSIPLLIRIILKRYDFKRHSDGDFFYQRMLYQTKDSLNDEELDNLCCNSFKKYIYDRIKNLYLDNPYSASTHLTMYEQLNYLTRGRNFISCGPAGLFEKDMTVLVPFLDREIFKLSMKLGSEQKIFNRFYNKLWRMKFPALAKIRKAGHAGRASDRDMVYLCKYLYSGILKKIHRTFGQIFSCDFLSEEVYFSLSEYIGNEDNQRRFDLLRYDKRNNLPADIKEHIEEMISRDQCSDLLYLRYLTLLAYFSQESPLKNGEM